MVGQHPRRRTSAGMCDPAMVGTAAPESGEGGEHGNPSVRMCEVERPGAGSCGFHLTRSRWDPYPWVSGVDAGSAADTAGLRSGDCLLEVNGEDVLGERVSVVAARVRARADRVALLLWNAGADPRCSPESLCCGPMPDNLQRLSACMGAILAALECPVCLDTIPPPAHQCANGHLICVQCRVKTERCPVCRMRFCRGRSLLADQVYHSLTEAFHLKDEPESARPAKLRERLFGSKKKVSPPPEVKTILAYSPKNKLLTRIMGKSSSVENLSTNPVTLSAMPRHLSATQDSEFNSGLKAKSLSTSEIFLPQSPCVSRSPSMTSTHRLGDACSRSRRPASYHGSNESLNGRLCADFGEDDGSLYHCPCEPSCPSLVQAGAVMAHIQDCHDGPLVQYFKPRVLLALPLPLEPTAVVAVSCAGATCFLRAVRQDGGWLVWLWLLGGKRETEAYRLAVTLKGAGDQPKEATFHSAAVSLSSASWADICKARRGVCLSAERLAELFPAETRAGCPLAMLVEVQELEDDVPK